MKRKKKPKIKIWRLECREKNEQTAKTRGYDSLKECHADLFKFWSAMSRGYDCFGRKEHMQRMIKFVEGLEKELCDSDFDFVNNYYREIYGKYYNEI